MTTTADLLRRLFAHLRWADEQTIATLHGPAVPQDARRRFMHVVAAEHVWLQRLRGAAPAVEVWPDWDAAACEQLMRDNHRGYEDLLAGADDAASLREVAYTNSAGQAFRDRAADILLQVATHGSWHRGQVALLLRERGLEPAATDYIAFVRGAPAARS